MQIYSLGLNVAMSNTNYFSTVTQPCSYKDNDFYSL